MNDDNHNKFTFIAYLIYSLSIFLFFFFWLIDDVHHIITIEDYIYFKHFGYYDLIICTFSIYIKNIKFIFILTALFSHIFLIYLNEMNDEIFILAIMILILYLSFFHNISIFGVVYISMVLN